MKNDSNDVDHIRRTSIVANATLYQGNIQIYLYFIFGFTPVHLSNFQPCVKTGCWNENNKL